MTPLDFLWHLFDFCAPAFTVGVVSTFAAKILWRQSMSARRWWVLASWGVGTCAVVLLLGLMLFGRDGKMATYGAMLVACAFVLERLGRAHGRP
jgi:hypothetical protein